MFRQAQHDKYGEFDTDRNYVSVSKRILYTQCEHDIEMKNKKEPLFTGGSVLVVRDCL